MRYQARLWLRDHWRWGLLVIPFGLAVFLALYFWPWGIIGSAIILFLTVTKVISWQRVRKGYGGMEFPGETILRAERPHWMAFFVFGWEWRKQPESKGSASILWRMLIDLRLWPIYYPCLLAMAARIAAFFPETRKYPAELGWVLGVAWFVSASYWWDFWVFVWPGYYAILTDQNITMVRPTRGPAGTVEPDSATVPLLRIGHWGTHPRAFGGGDWDPSFVFGEERVVFRFLKDPEDFSRAAREQAARLEAQRRR